MIKSSDSVQIRILVAVIAVIAGLLGYGYYSQYVNYLDPCPLCMTQRFFYYMIAICAFIALLFHWLKRGRLMRTLSYCLMMVGGAGGMVTAGRQIWLQHLPPDKVPECGLGLAYWLENEPWLKTLGLLFKGDGNCAEVKWQFLGFSMGEWSFAWFVVLTLTTVYLLIRSRRVLA